MKKKKKNEDEKNKKLDKKKKSSWDIGFSASRPGCRRTKYHQVATSDLALSNDDECDNQVHENLKKKKAKKKN